MKVNLNASSGVKTSRTLIGALKMAHMAEMPEEEFGKLLKELEGNRYFRLLKASGAINLAEFPSARYAARRYAGYGLRSSCGDLPVLTDGKGDLIRLIQGIGQEKFEVYFLRDAPMSDIERAEECSISVKDSERLRDFVNRVYMQVEFEGVVEAPVSKVFSAVAGIQIENRVPVLAFFHREIWKGRYKVDGDKLSELLRGMPDSERAGVEKVLKRVEFADKRKTTLYRALEILISTQADYLLSGEPERRLPFLQKTLAKNLGVDISVLNRLISNKSLQMPWGTEAPMSVLLPSPKKINLARVYALAVENPGLSDEGLSVELKVQYGIELSRRSVAQYRKDLALSAGGER